MDKRSPSIPLPQNVHDLRRLLDQYGGMLSPQNRSLIMEVIQNLEHGADTNSLQTLASRVQRQAQTQQRQQQQPSRRQGQQQARTQAQPRPARPAPGRQAAPYPASNQRQGQRPGWR